MMIWRVFARSVSFFASADSARTRLGILSGWVSGSAVMMVLRAFVRSS